MRGFTTLAELLDGLPAFGERPAIMVDRGESFSAWSFAALTEVSHRLATGLLASGVGRQEPVAILSSNRAEWIIAYFGIVASGAMAVPLDHLAGEGEIATMLSKCGCRRLFTTRDRLSRLPASWADGRGAVYLLDGDLPDDEPPNIGSIGVHGAPPSSAVSWRRLLAERAGPLPAIAPDQRASLLFTSGTTGPPKAVPLTHANFVANLRGLLDAGIAAAGDRVLLPLPLHHAYPFTVGMLGALASGATLVLPAGMTGPEILHAVRAARTSVIIGVPGLYGAMLNGIEARIARRGKAVARTYGWLLALSIWLGRTFGLRIGRLLFRRLHAEFGGALRILASGGAKLDAEVAWKLEGLGWRVLSGYGLTETAPILTFNPPERARLDSEGLPIAGVEIRVGSPEGDMPGEILARGASVFAGYLDDPTASMAAFADGGWFRTGDLGFLDPDGYLHVVGRANEAIVLPTGKKLFPDDIEAVYAGMPFAREVAVLLRDGALVALIVPEPEAIRERGAARVEALLREAVERHVASLKPQERISGYAFFREPLPRTHLGKLKRHLLPALYAQAEAGLERAAAAALSEEDRGLLAASPAREIWAWLASRYPDRRLTLETSPQLDLGIDSLKWIELTTEIQDRFGVRLTEAAIGRIITLRDLLREIAQAGGAAPGAVPGAPAPVPALAPTPEQARWLAPPGIVSLLFGLALYAAVKLAMRLLFRLQVRGRSAIPKDEPLVFTPNHASYLDPLTLAAAFEWRELRRTSWAGWTGLLFSTWFMRAVSRTANVLPIDPDRDPGAALALSAAVLRQGRRLVWFPEGRRSPTGEITEFLPGIAVLLSKTGVRAVPVRIGGTFEAWPGTRRIPRLRRLCVTFGPALGADELARRGRGKDENARIASALRDCVAALPEA
jgi:long-chain acyl-CoA synthetase